MYFTRDLINILNTIVYYRLFGPKQWDLVERCCKYISDAFNFLSSDNFIEVLVFLLKKDLLNFTIPEYILTREILLVLPKIAVSHIRITSDISRF